MVKLCSLIFATWWLLLVDGLLPLTHRPSQSRKFLARQQHSEYALLDDDGELSGQTPPFAEEQQTIPTTQPDDFSGPRHIVALRRGAVVKIIVGSNSRKAWKKRRRSGSPLLVACSIQGMDELSAIRCNVLSLLRNSRVNVNLLASQYHKNFGEVLMHSGFEDTVDLLQQIFKNPKYKVNVMEKNGMWYLESYRHRSELTPMLEFNQEYRHTGVLADGESVSAALRISSTETIPEPGTELFAVVWDFEPEGDAGFPLVIVSLTPPQSNNNDQTRAPVKRHKVALEAGCRLRGVATKKLRWGVLVECLPSRMNKAPIRGLLLFRDACLPADPQRDEIPEMKDGEEEEDVYGIGGTIDELFNMNDDEDFDEDSDDDDDDKEEDISALFENSDDEEEDDITDMFHQNEDGSLSYTNPETGLVETIEMLDEEENYDEEEVEEDNTVGAYVSPETENTTPSAQPPAMPRYRKVRVNVGDQVDVFVKSHSPNQRKLFLTMDPTIKDLPKKERRHRDAVSKRTERLARRLGGFKAILKLRGTECEGIVKATSNMGDRRLYIQPNEDLPVGVATCLDDDLLDVLQQGDSVRVRLDGLDEQRGQLAMCVLERIDRELIRKHKSSSPPPLDP